MSGNPNRKDCSDSSSDRAYKDPFSTQNQVVWASPERRQYRKIKSMITINQHKSSPMPCLTISKLANYKEEN